jgi:hypothetical protein
MEQLAKIEQMNKASTKQVKKRRKRNKKKVIADIVPENLKNRFEDCGTSSGCEVLVAPVAQPILENEVKTSLRLKSPIVIHPKEKRANGKIF